MGRLIGDMMTRAGITEDDLQTFDTIRKFTEATKTG